MSDWEKVDLVEVLGAAVISLGVGMIRLLMFIRDKRNVHWFDLMLEPMMAVFGGMVMWALSEYTKTPDIIQAVVTSLGAWGGPRTIHWAERKYFGGSRAGDTTPGELGGPEERK